MWIRRWNSNNGISEWFYRPNLHISFPCRIQKVLLILQGALQSRNKSGLIWCSRDNDQFLPDRICQALEAIEEIDSKRDLADAVIYAGDFNTEQGDLPHQILAKMGGLQDARGDVSPDPSFNAHWNTYFNPKERTATIDYVLIGTNLGTKVAKTHCQNPLPSQIPRKNVRYFKFWPLIRITCSLTFFCQFF